MAEEQEKKQGTDPDLDSLKLEIDKEIDAMFVPAKPKPVETPQIETPLAMEEDTETASPAPPPPAQNIGRVGAATKAAINIESLQLEIDKEIDSLFTPRFKEPPPPPTPEEINALVLDREEATEPVPEPKLVLESEAAPISEQPLVLESEAAPVAQAPPEEQPSQEAPTGFMAQYRSRAELPGLIEEFNAAYLSLDWEFSTENIHRLESALENLSSFTSASPGSASIFKILKTLLARLAARPQAANSWIIELVRDSQGLLAHLLLTEGAPGIQEKERINALISRFRQMREKASLARIDAVPESARPVAEEAPTRIIESPAAPGPRPVAETPQPAQPEPVPEIVEPVQPEPMSEILEPAEPEPEAEILEPAEPEPEAAIELELEELEPEAPEAESLPDEAEPVFVEAAEPEPEEESKPAAAAEPPPYFEPAPAAEPYASRGYAPTEVHRTPDYFEPNLELGPGEESPGKMPDRWSLLELRTWIKSSRSLLNEAVTGFDLQLDRLKLIESALGKTAALAPVVSRIADIRGGLEHNLELLRGQNVDWDNRADWVENLARFSSAYDEKVHGEQTDLHPTPEIRPSREIPIPKFEELIAAQPEADAAEDLIDVVLFHYAGKFFGLPASNVAKSVRLSAKKASEIADRGYGTLADVKSFFGGIRSGLTGPLAGMPKQELKALRFDIIDPEVFDAVPVPPDAHMAIFVSNGTNHGLILADSEKITLQKGAELVNDTCACSAAIGKVRAGSGMMAEVLDAEQLLRHQE